jgi:hypothetical protein
MTMIAGNSTVYQPPRGRKVKFTPAVLEQVKQWVEAGFNRNEIAQQLGTSVGSLQVTCSRLGIRLRRPRQGRRVQQSLATAPSLATYSINGHPLSLTREEETKLALEAAMRGIKLGDLLQQIVLTAIEQHLVTVNGVKDGGS